MRHFLLLTVLIISTFFSHAETIVFDFLHETYGLTRESQSSAPNIPAGTTITNQGVNISFYPVEGYGFRLWKDGLRVYTGSVSFTFSGKTVTNIRLYNGTTLLATGSNTTESNPFTIGWDVSERTTISKMEVDVVSTEDVTFDFVNNTYGLPRQSNSGDPYIESGTSIYNSGVTMTFDANIGNGFRLWYDGLRVYKGECSFTISASDIIKNITVYYNKNEKAEFVIDNYEACILCTFANRGSIQKVIVSFGNSSSTPVVPVSSIQLSPSSCTGMPGESQRLDYTVYPSNATVKSVMWASSNNDVATVDSGGTVHFLEEGECAIFAMAMDGSGVYGVCQVKVKSPEITKTVEFDFVNYTYGLTRQTQSEAPYISEGTSISNEGVSITFDKNVGNGFRLWKDGLRVYKGECMMTLSAPSRIETITVYYNKGAIADFNIGSETANLICTFAERGSIQRIVVTYTTKAPAQTFIPVSDITLIPSSCSGVPGGSQDLQYKISPSNATEQSIMWSISDNDVATIDTAGTVYFKSEGKCTVYALATDGSGVYGTCEVTVNKPQNEPLTISLNYYNATLKVGESLLLEAEVKDNGNTKYSHCYWTSLNPNVVSVEDGYVTAVGRGATKVCFTAVDTKGSEYRVFCDFTVINDASVSTIEIDDVESEVYTLQGVKIDADNLTPGIYILRKGNETKKIVIR